MYVYIIDEKQSKRAFDGRIRAWRRKLHEWDISPADMPVAIPKLIPAVDMNGEVIFPLQLIPNPAVRVAAEPLEKNGEKNPISGTVNAPFETVIGKEKDVNTSKENECEDRGDDEDDDVL